MRGLAYFALCLVCAACSRAPERDLFKEGETLFLNGEYDAAVEVFKQRLVQDPNDAGAHFYLGNCCFYNTDNNWLGIALGELETALSLFERQGKVNPVPRFSAEYFEMICHVNQAYIYYSLIGFLADNPRQFGGVDARAVLPKLLKNCMEQADIAEQVSPGHPDVVKLKRLIQKLVDGAGPASTPQTAPTFSG